LQFDGFNLGGKVILSAKNLSRVFFATIRRYPFRAYSCLMRQISCYWRGAFRFLQ